MDDELYQQAILRHARSAHGAGRLTAPDARAMVDNPLCGDRVTVEMTLERGRVTGLAHQVRGCLLCQASAAILAQGSVGRSAAEIDAAAAALDGMIRRGGPVPEGWPDLSAFLPVQGTRSRHDCVLLPFQAARQALQPADAAAG